jgi:hypothetical protein
LGTWELAREARPVQAVVRAETPDEAVRLALSTVSNRNP